MGNSANSYGSSPHPHASDLLRTSTGLLPVVVTAFNLAKSRRYKARVVRLLSPLLDARTTTQCSALTITCFLRWIYTLTRGRGASIKDVLMILYYPGWTKKPGRICDKQAQRSIVKKWDEPWSTEIVRQASLALSSSWHVVLAVLARQVFDRSENMAYRMVSYILISVFSIGSVGQRHGRRAGPQTRQYKMQFNLTNNLWERLNNFSNK